MGIVNIHYFLETENQHTVTGKPALKVLLDETRTTRLVPLLAGDAFARRYMLLLGGGGGQSTRWFRRRQWRG